MPPRRKKARRTRSPRCLTRGCDRIARIEGFCKTHAKRLADSKFSRRVRSSGRCHAASAAGWIGPTFDCKGPLQCAHLISRSYLNTRWDYDNARALCAAHHRWLDTHPVEKEMMAENWSDYGRLKRVALDRGVDWREALAVVIKEE